MHLIKDKYYIVDSTDLLNPRLLRNKFNTPEEAEEAIIRYLGSLIKFQVVSYEDCIKYGLEFKRRTHHEGNNKIRLTKYDYPPDRVLHQGRKSYRTKVRRWKRELKAKAKKKKTILNNTN